MDNEFDIVNRIYPSISLNVIIPFSSSTDNIINTAIEGERESTTRVCTHNMRHRIVLRYRQYPTSPLLDIIRERKAAAFSDIIVTFREQQTSIP